MMKSKFATGFEITVPRHIEEVVILSFEYGKGKEDIILPKKLFDITVSMYPKILNAKQMTKVERRIE